jgi:hypothetical protein
MVKRSPRSISAAPAGKRPRGRPPKPGGRIPQVEVQRAYRARLGAPGKAVRVVDAIPVRPASASLAPAVTPHFDPARDRFYERDMFEKMHDDLHNALLEVERRRDDVARYWLRVSSRVGSTGKVLKMWNSGTIARFRYRLPFLWGSRWPKACSPGAFRPN